MDMSVFTSSTRDTLTSSTRLRGKPRLQHYKTEVFFVVELGGYGALRAFGALKGGRV